MCLNISHSATVSVNVQLLLWTFTLADCNIMGYGYMLRLNFMLADVFADFCIVREECDVGILGITIIISSAMSQMIFQCRKYIIKRMARTVHNDLFLKCKLVWHYSKSFPIIMMRILFTGTASEASSRLIMC